MFKKILGYVIHSGGYCPCNVGVVARTDDHMYTLWKVYVYIDNGKVSTIYCDVELLNIDRDDIENEYKGRKVFKTIKEAEKERRILMIDYDLDFRKLLEENGLKTKEETIDFIRKV